jgi:hypothetical protein
MATKSHLRYNNNDLQIESSDPSAKLIRECIEKLDNVSRSDVNLTLNSLHINICGGNGTRVSVMVTKTDNQSPVLVLKDPTVNDRQDITLLTGGQYVEEPLDETVPRQRAIDVVLYCFENDAIPDGLEWAER